MLRRVRSHGVFTDLRFWERDLSKPAVSRVRVTLRVFVRVGKILYVEARNDL